MRSQVQRILGIPTGPWQSCSEWGHWHSLVLHWQHCSYTWYWLHCPHAHRPQMLENKSVHSYKNVQISDHRPLNMDRCCLVLLPQPNLDQVLLHWSNACQFHSNFLSLQLQGNVHERAGLSLRMRILLYVGRGSRTRATVTHSWGTFMSVKKVHSVVCCISGFRSLLIRTAERQYWEVRAL